MKRSSFYHTRKRVAEIERLNKSVQRKKQRVKRLYGVNIDQELKELSDFDNSKDYRNYIKELEKIADRDNYRYVKLDSGDVVSRDEILELQSSVKSRNKANRKRLKKALKEINKDREVALTLKDFDENPDLYYDNLESLRPVKATFKEVKENYQYGSSIERATKQNKKVATWSYERYSKQTFFENFKKSVRTEWGAFSASKLLLDYVDKRGATWLYNMYIRGKINPFEFVYKYKDLVRRFVATMQQFGFVGEGVDIRDWTVPK